MNAYILFSFLFISSSFFYSHSFVNAQQISEARNLTQTECVQSCATQDYGSSSGSCCGCCDSDQTCNSYPEVHACCGQDQDFCGCFSNSGTCKGTVFGAPAGDVYNQAGTCYDYLDYSVCSFYEDIWILCPNNYTVCYSYDYTDATCCLAETEYCSQDPNVHSAQCVPGIYLPGGDPLVCGGVVCGDAGNLCCNDANLGPTCYDQTAYACQASEVGSLLCGNDGTSFDLACGYACYSPDSYYCCDNQLFQLSQSSSCSPTSVPTGSSVPTTVSPVSNPSCASVTCASSDRCCDDAVIGAVCYDPVLYNCTQGGEGSILCGYVNGQAQACGAICYDAQNYHCESGQLASGI